MYYDLLARIKNALREKKETVHAPFSKFDFAVARALADVGYIALAEKRTVGRKTALEVRLKYRDGEPALHDFRLLSKPSRRLYAGYRSVRPVKHGHGIAILSTPAGVMGGKEARKKKVGGEYLFEVW